MYFVFYNLLCWFFCKTVNLSIQVKSNKNTKILPTLLAHGMGHEIACVLLTSKRRLRPQQALSPLSCPQFVSEKKSKEELLFITGCRRRGRRKFERQRWRQCWNLSNVYILVQALKVTTHPLLRIFCVSQMSAVHCNSTLFHSFWQNKKKYFQLQQFGVENSKERSVFFHSVVILSFMCSTWSIQRYSIKIGSFSFLMLGELI